MDRAVERLEVLDVTDGFDPIRSMEACEDRFGYLMGPCFETFGQQVAPLGTTPQPVIR